MECNSEGTTEMSKPDNWSKLSGDEQFAIAQQLLRSPRGNYILAQALWHAIGTMQKVEPPFRERSNIEDMEMLTVLCEPHYSQFGRDYALLQMRIKNIVHVQEHQRKVGDEIVTVPEYTRVKKS